MAKIESYKPILSMDDVPIPEDVYDKLTEKATEPDEPKLPFVHIDTSGGGTSVTRIAPKRVEHLLAGMRASIAARKKYLETDIFAEGAAALKERRRERDRKVFFLCGLATGIIACIGIYVICFW